MGWGCFTYSYSRTVCMNILIVLKDLFRETLIQNIFLGPLGDVKNEKKLDPDPQGCPC